MTQSQNQVQEIRKQRNAPIYYKSMAQQATIDEEKRTVEFYFSVWGVRDLNGEKTVKGCFAKSIKEHGPGSVSPQKIPLLYEHDFKLPLGKPTSIIEDDYGAKAIVPFDNIPRCDEVLQQIKSGTINQYSFGYKYIWDRTEWEESTKSLVLYEVQLFELTVTVIGVNEATHTVGFKSLNQDENVEELTNETELFIKGLDSTKQLQARSIIHKHIALTQAAGLPKPPLGTPPAVNVKEAINNFNF